MARDQFEQQLITMYELMDSNRRAIEAKIGALAARYDYLRTIAELKKNHGHSRGTTLLTLFDIRFFVNTRIGRKRC